MKKGILRKALCVVLMLTFLATTNLPLAVSAIAYAPEDHTQSGNEIRNEYLYIVTDENDSFYFHTVEGDPQSDTDDNKRLLYNGTSYTYLSIDGSVCKFEADGYNYVTEDGNSLYSVDNIAGIQVQRILSFQYNTYTGRNDIAEFRYVITNNSDSVRSVGARLMFDTMLGDNDSAPFKVNGTDVTTRTEYVGENVPQNWYVFDYLLNPTVVASGTFYNNVSERPDRVQFNNWSDSSNTVWDVDCNGGSIGDSAVNIYYNPIDLAPGESRTVKTVYGISAFVPSDNCNHRDANDDYACDYCGEAYDDGSEFEPIYSFTPSVMAPQSLVANAETNTYDGNPFAFNAWILNNGNMPLENVKITLNLPDGLSAGESASVTLESLDINETYAFFRSVTVEPQSSDKTFTYSIEISADNVETMVEEHTIFVPALDIGCQHDVGVNFVVDVPSTCTELGSGHYECAGCGKYISEGYAPVAGHDYKIVETVEPTCTEDGCLYFKCSREGCDAQKQQTLTATGHSFDADGVCMNCGYERYDHTHSYTCTEVAATCTSMGYTEFACGCGYSYRADYVEMLGHRWGEGVEVVAKTCTEHGVMRYSCERCDATYDSVVVADHDWQENVTVEATCTTDGELVRTCSVCEATEIEVIPAAHTWNEGEVTLAPTCEENGEKLCVCEVCYESAYLEIDKLGHSYVNGVCTRCGEKFIYNVTEGDHPEYGMYFEIEDIVSNYGPDIINEYGLLLDYNEGAMFDKVAIYLTQDGTMWRRCIACTGENIEYATYVPYLSYGDDIKYTGLNSDWINIFRLSENADGIWCYSNYATIGVNLEDNQGNLLLSLYDIGQAGTETRIFDDLSEMIEWLSEGNDNDECEHSAGRWVTVNEPTYTSEGLRVKRCVECNAILESEILPMLDSAMAKVETDSEYTVVDNDIVFTLTVENCDLATALALVPQFDTDLFELVSAQWSIDGALIQDVEEGSNRAISAWGQATDVNTVVFTFTLRAKADCESATVGCVLMAEVDKEQIDIFVLSYDVEILPCDHSQTEIVFVDEDHHSVTCVSCGYTKAVEHGYDSNCDISCDDCGYERVAPHDYSEQLACDASGHWQVCDSCGATDVVEEHVYDGNADCDCNDCGYVRFVRGDVDGDGDVDSDDSVYLIYNVFFGEEEYPVSQGLDFDGDGEETTDDGIYHLYYVYFGEESYPLH